jgi:hypothetical protein
MKEELTIKVTKTIQEQQFEPLQIGIERTLLLDKKSTAKERASLTQELIDEVQTLIRK